MTFNNPTRNFKVSTIDEKAYLTVDITVEGLFTFATLGKALFPANTIVVILISTCHGQRGTFSTRL